MDIADLQNPIQDKIEKALQLGASGAKIAFRRSERTDCGFEAGRLKETGSRQTASYDIEVLVDGRRGNTSGNRLEDMGEMLRRAITLAKAGSAAHFDAYPPSKDTATVATYSDRTHLLSRERMIEGCQQITSALEDYDSELFITCSSNRTESETLLITSGGVCHGTKRTHWKLGAYVQRTRGTDMLFAGYSRGWRDLNEFYDPDVIAKRIITDLRRGETIAEPPRKRATLYLPPETVRRFLWPIFMGTNGRNVAKGDSPLVGKLDQFVLAPSLTIIDNPHQDYASGAREMDGDGIPTERQTIFEEGRLMRFLYDLDSAGLAGTEPTGNNGCMPYSPVLTPGSQPSSQLLEEINDGLYICDLLGFGQSNIINGDFSANVGLGYRISNGQIIGRVKNTMIAGNLYDVLSKGVRVSSDTEHEGRYPHVVADGVSVSSA